MSLFEDSVCPWCGEFINDLHESVDEWGDGKVECPSCEKPVTVSLISYFSVEKREVAESAGAA